MEKENLTTEQSEYKSEYKNEFIKATDELTDDPDIRLQRFYIAMAEDGIE